MEHPDFAEEKSRLDDILGYLHAYNKVITKQRGEIDVSVAYSLEHYNDDNPEQFNELVTNINRQEFLHQKTRDVAKALLKPYFARVDFAEEGKGGPQKLYIGKMTLFDKSGSAMLIIDWRAPVSTLYYEGRIGEAAYDCPDGLISGDISLKRQFVIENAKLEDVMDIDITTNDTFLQAALGASKDNRLHDIVTTIQAEQNRIIRADMFRPLIVQGAAGSGKTTIALHRVAYLLYTYEETVKPKNIMIIAPSKFFLSYISGVLPELGVENVVQTTYEDLAQNVIGHRLRIKPAVQTLSEWIEGGATAATPATTATPATATPPATAASVTGSDATADWRIAARIKSSYEFYRLFERYFEWIEKSALPKTAFVIEGFEIVPHDIIAKMFFVDYAYLPLSVRLREIKKSLSNILRREKKRVVEELHADYGVKHNAILKRMRDSAARRQKIIDLLAERDGIITKFLNRCKTAIPSYLNKFKIHPALAYYTGLIGNGKIFNYLAKGVFTPEECAVVSRHTMAVVGSGRVESEDLAPLMFLRFKVHGLEDPLEIKHIVIDEAQDFSIFQFRVLKLILGTGSFSILGDLHQGIYSYKGIGNWGELTSPSGGDSQIIFDRPQVATLEQSYRTTVEIMEMANVVIGKLALPGVPLAKPVIRHGSPVEIFQKESNEAIASAIKVKIDEYKAAGYQSIAIICKTAAEAKLFKKLLPAGIQMVTGAESDFEQGIKLIPSYHVKGLEFDAVCIANASEEQYFNELDNKLLYIAMTRALHALAIYSRGRLSRFLS
ncbi:MAG: UvrD-helicase domain-containing protein [Oscillospiraceae bacterium]|nr:UvrD-helicase domain-containing protein [Oscillospiraceae bacterium]